MVPRKLERRAFLKSAALATAGLAAVTSGGLLALSEYSAPSDLAGFERALELLGSY